MNNYLESIRILLEIDEPNRELFDLIKSFPIKLIDNADSLFNNGEFDLKAKVENTNYRIIKKDKRIRLSSSLNGINNVLDVYECLYDDDIKSIAEFHKFSREDGKINSILLDSYFIYGNELITSIRSTDKETISYTSKLKKSKVKCKK